MTLPLEQWSLLDFTAYLKTLSKPVVNDRRQRKYCEYISLFLSHFGNERCMVVGSTQENMRLRLREDEGDFDYLVISAFSIPEIALEYHDHVPCFVHINTEKFSPGDCFPSVELMEGKYLPSNLLIDVRPEVFKHLRDVFKIVTKPGTRRGRHTLRVIIDKRIKPGISIGNYANAECTDMILSLKEPQRNRQKIFSEIRKRIQNEPTGVQNKILSTLETITKVGLVVKKIVGNADENDQSVLLQSYGPIMEAVSDQDEHDLTATEDTDSDYNKANSEPNDSDEYVLLKYTYKTSKDFIPAFQIKGKPQFLKQWRERKRRSNWPPTSTVEIIYNAEIFVVAKPAVKQPNKDKDFCLGFNIAENELALAMTETQKNVLLTIKALHKGSLKKYSDILSTFYWKTALYWVSERVNSHVLHGDNETVEVLLHEVLSFMAQCLHKNSLEHYFIPSNLFAGIDPQILCEAGDTVNCINLNPMNALREFVSFQNQTQVEVEWVPRSKIEECNTIYKDKGASTAVDDVITLILRFIEEDPNNLKKALARVLKEAMPFIIEEEMRGRKPSKTSAVVEYLLSVSVVQNLLINILLCYITFDRKRFTFKCLLSGVLLLIIQLYVPDFFNFPTIPTILLTFGICKLCSLFF